MTEPPGARLPVGNVTVEVSVIVGGMMLDDGRIYRELTAADFDELGQYRLRFIMPAGAQTANCHRIRVLQGTALVGTY